MSLELRDKFITYYVSSSQMIIVTKIRVDI